MLLGNEQRGEMSKYMEYIRFLSVVLVNVEVDPTDGGRRTDNICDTIEMDIYGIREMFVELENIDEQVHTRCTLGIRWD